MSDAYLDRLAKPGDPDLELDLSGVILDSVMRLGDEIVFGWHGGLGVMTSDDGVTGDSMNVGGTAAFGYKMDPGYEHLLDRIVARLEEWRVEGTMLRLTCAPGRYSVLASDETDRKTWVPIPNGRSHDPGTFDPPAPESTSDESSSTSEEIPPSD